MYMKENMRKTVSNSRDKRINEYNLIRIISNLLREKYLPLKIPRVSYFRNITSLIANALIKH